MTRPGEVAGRPKLVLRYPTAADRVADLLPAGLEMCGEPVVQIGVYCVPVHGEPEHGISVRVPARFDGVDGQYSLGIGIDQESAIFISRETNGQPKFPCSVRLFRLGDGVHASATHQGHTFMSFDGTVGGTVEPTGEEVQENEWWIKVSRAVGGAEKAYDFPPHVVAVRTTGTMTHCETVDGDLVLRSSPWDPVADLLPMAGEATAELVTMRHTGRSIALAGPLDPDAFWPHADTIGGSRWPGEHGGPRPLPGARP
jgi:acetoacetate decarboxylase